MKLKTSENTFVMNGTVKEINPKGESKTEVVLSVSDYDSEAKKNVNRDFTIDFWNSKDRENIKLSDWVRKANVGSQLLVSVYQNDKGDFLGNSFGYDSLKYTTKKDEVKYENNVIQGYACNTRLNTTKEGKKYFTCSVAEGKEKETKWHNISIFSTDKNPNFADNIFNLLKETEGKDGKTNRVKAVFFCGEDKHFGKNVGDEEYETSHSYYASSVEKVNFPERELNKEIEEAEKVFEENSTDDLDFE